MTEAAPAAATPHASPPSGGGEDPRGAAATTTGAAAARGVPWATVTACAIVVGVFGVTHLTPGAMPFASWGYRGDAFQVWSGAPWVLVTSAFVHLWVWHVALNVYGLWVLGRALEASFGRRALALLLLASAFASSAVQLALFDDVGVGASGMVYALFGFGWVARARSDVLTRLFTPRLGLLLVGWFVACWVALTREVGNGAHLGGLLLGAAAAEAVVMRRRPRLAKAGLVLLLLLSVTVSFVCPWSPTWWATRGWHAHAGGRYALAIDAYGLSLQLRPDQPWVLASLVRAHRAAGDAEAAAAVLERLRTVSPEDAEQLDEESTAAAP